MALSQIIVTSRYLKSGSANKKKNYIKYIATRETVEFREQNHMNKNAPATKKQQELILSLLKDFPEAKKYLEFEDFKNHTTIENASELISTIIERNADLIGNRQNFVGYVAMRPSVEKRGSHGLFNESDEPIVLDKVANEVANHKGNVWSHVVSLRREDSIRLGFDNSERWRELVKRHIATIANQSKIPLFNLKWYAAYHDTTHHPHIHLIVYSENPKQGYLTKEGINKIRSTFANDIFHDDLQSIYQEQTIKRNELKAESKKYVESVLKEIASGNFQDKELQQLIQKLYSELENCTGKKVYGYVPPQVKNTVNEIFVQLAKDRNIELIYHKWCELERQKYKTYTQKEKEFPPLHENKVFHSVRNMIIQQVLNMNSVSNDFEIIEEIEPLEFDHENSEDTHDFVEVEIQEDIEEPKDMPPSNTEDAISDGGYYIKWSNAYKSACSLMYKNNKTQKDFNKVEKRLLAESKLGNVLAIHDLGKLYGMDKFDKKDDKKSFEHYEEALQGFMQIEPNAHSMILFETKYPNPVDMRSYIWYRIGKFHCYGMGTEQNYEEAFQWFLQSAQQLNEKNQGNIYAQYSLGNLYYYGNGVEKDIKKAFEWYMKSAKQGQPYAAYAIAQMFQQGQGTEKNDDKSASYYKQALNGFLKLEAKEQADDNLLYKIGVMYKSGFGTDMDMEKAIAYFIQSAELGNKHGLYEYGKVLLEGNDIEQNIEKALKHLKKSIKLENINAKRYLAQEYIVGENLEQDIEKGITMLTECADSGDALSAYKLGKIYFKGEVVYKDLEKAEKYFLISTQKENEFAQYALGKLYLSEEKYNLNKAVYWLEEAIKQETISNAAEYQLAKLLLEDHEYHNTERAISLLEKSAEKNNWSSFLLGRLYLYGTDEIQKDKEKAIEWLILSAEQGNAYAQNLLQNIDNFENIMFQNTIASLFMNLSRCIAEDYNHRFQSNKISVDQKLKRMIQQKKQAQGIKNEPSNQIL